MILDYEKLWKPYSADGNTLENTLRYLQKIALHRGVSPFIVDVAVRQIFMEVAKGKKFPKDRCPCGCGIDKAGTAITHAMAERMLKLDGEEKKKFARWLETRENVHQIGQTIDQLNEASDALKTTEVKGLWDRIKDGLFRRSNSRDISGPAD